MMEPSEYIKQLWQERIDKQVEPIMTLDQFAVLMESYRRLQFGRRSKYEPHVGAKQRRKRQISAAPTD